MGLIDTDKNYVLDKKEVLSAMEMIHDAVTQNEALAKLARSLSDILKSASVDEKAKSIIEDMKMDIDICNIYMKEVKAKMIKITKNQLPF